MPGTKPSALNDLKHTLRNKIGSIEWHCRRIEEANDLEHARVHVEGIRKALREIESALARGDIQEDP